MGRPFTVRASRGKSFRSASVLIGAGAGTEPTNESAVIATPRSPIFPPAAASSGPPLTTTRPSTKMCTTSGTSSSSRRS